MNKRQWKKANKKADMWVGLDTIPYRCRYCYNFESGDMTVGFFDACVANYLYDKMVITEKICTIRNQNT